MQRRYPQIYKSNDRLLLKPETIEVELRDFMISVKSRVLFLELVTTFALMMTTLRARALLRSFLSIGSLPIANAACSSPL